jgi:hypothetical protein
MPARGGAHSRNSTDDDPLTSQAFSRSALTETDGRSYRAAARRSQAQTELTEQTESFITGQYPQSGQYQAGRTGEYWQYRDDAPTTITQAPAGRYPTASGQGPASQGLDRQGLDRQGPAAQGGKPAQPGRGPGYGGQSGQSSRTGGRPAAGLPGGDLPGSQYDPQQSRTSQQRQAQHRQPSQTQSPAAGLSAGSLPAAGPSGGAAAGPSASNPANARPSGSGGLNPYDSGGGTYPYPSQSYLARTATAGPAQDSTDDPYYQPSLPDRYAAGGASQGRADQGTAGYGNGYPKNGDRRY